MFSCFWRLVFRCCSELISYNLPLIYFTSGTEIKDKKSTTLQPPPPNQWHPVTHSLYIQFHIVCMYQGRTIKWGRGEELPFVWQDVKIRRERKQIKRGIEVYTLSIIDKHRLTDKHRIYRQTQNRTMKYNILPKKAHNEPTNTECDQQTHSIINKHNITNKHQI